MRAALPGGEIVLRIGWLQDGRVVEERKLRRGQTLSVGSSEKCDFTLGPAEARRFLQLFGWNGKTARLTFVIQANGEPGSIGPAPSGEWKSAGVDRFVRPGPR